MHLFIIFLLSGCQKTTHDKIWPIQKPPLQTLNGVMDYYQALAPWS